MTYAEYLKSQGATDADIQVLDTPVARKAFESLNTELTAQKQLVKDTEDWFTGPQTDEWNKLNSDVINARAEAARFKAALRTAQDRGLLNITKDLGLDDGGNPANPNPANPNPAAPAIDPTKYVTIDQARQMANDERRAILLAQDIAAEHAVLFPGQRLNFTQLGEEALVAKKTVQQHWMDKYKVPEARESQTKAAQAAHDKQVADAAVKAAREEWSKNFGSNPDQRVHMPSTSSITVRKSADGAVTQPWQRGEDEASNDRVRRALERQRARESGATVQ